MKTKKTFIVLCPEGHALLPISSLLGVIKKLENAVNSIKSTLGDIRLADLPQEEILKMLSFTEKLDKSLRSCVKEDVVTGKVKPGNLEMWSDVHVYEYPKAILLMDFPPLVNSSYRYGEYGLSKRAEIELFKWFHTRTLPDFDENNRFLYIYKRYVSGPIDMASDNDNWEMKRITNAVSQAIGFSDNPRFSEFFYTSVHSNFDGAELMLIRHKDLFSFIDYLDSGTPIHPDSGSFFIKKQVEKSSNEFPKNSFFIPDKGGKNRNASRISDNQSGGLRKLTDKNDEEGLPF